MIHSFHNSSMCNRVMHWRDDEHRCFFCFSEKTLMASGNTLGMSLRSSVFMVRALRPRSLKGVDDDVVGQNALCQSSPKRFIEVFRSLNKCLAFVKLGKNQASSLKSLCNP